MVVVGRFDMGRARLEDVQVGEQSCVGRPFLRQIECPGFSFRPASEVGRTDRCGLESVQEQMDPRPRLSIVAGSSRGCPPATGAG